MLFQSRDSMHCNSHEGGGLSVGMRSYRDQISWYATQENFEHLEWEIRPLDCVSRIFNYKAWRC